MNTLIPAFPHASAWTLTFLAATMLGACDDTEHDADSEPSSHEEHPDDLDFSSADDRPPAEAINCAQSKDTGYDDGTPFEITLVTVDGKPVELHTANAFYVMQQAAAANGVGLVVVSGFRTMAEQEHLYGCYLNCTNACSSCNLAAKPGYSNHQRGLALDLNTSAPGVYAWLTSHAATYGFKRTVPTEEWHWEWTGDSPGTGPCGIQVPPPPPKPAPHRTPQSTTRDYNGDGRDDLFWYQPGDGVDPLWFGAAGHSFTKTYAPNVTGLYLTVAGDFNADGKADVLFYAPGTNPEAIWNGQADGSFAKSTPKHADGSVFNVSGDYTPLAGDFDGDGHDDVFWYAPGEVADILWYGQGGNKFTSVSVAVNGSYVPTAGDFDGDHRTDILWYGGTDAYESVWYGSKSRTLGFDKLTTNKVSGLYLPFAGDFDGDGDDDIFWYAPGDAQDNLWLGAPARVFSHTQPLTPDGTPWNVQGDFEPIPGDFDHNGLSDIFWYGPGADPDSVWYATGKGRFDAEVVAVNGTYAPV